MKIYEVIMAGGGGSRFWPLSRQKKPKQLLNLSGGDIMLNETILRMEPLISREDAYIVTNREQAGILKSLLLPEVPESHVLLEPVGRNTAPCILYSALTLEKKHGDGIMCVFPADHHIARPDRYRQVLKEAAGAAEQTGRLVTIGIRPDRPATGYGYIACGRQVRPGVFEADRFVEKPDQKTAETYLAQGNYLWNSGVFVWKISAILKAFADCLPQMYQAMRGICGCLGTDREQEAVDRVYPQLESISVDYGIMEKSAGVLVLPGDFGWNDVGSLDALPVFHEKDGQGNLFLGDVLALDTAGCIVKGEKKLIALNGVQDLMVIDTEDALLVCPKDRAQDVRKIVELLHEQGRKEQ